MTNLLIHSNNTSLTELKEFQKHNVDFKIPSDTDVDHYISDIINEQIEPVNPDTIFIKYALGNDYLAFLGLRLAHHIRLNNCRNGLSKIPIIFVGEETVSELIRISDYSDILATSGVYYVNEELNKVKVLLNRIDQDSLEGLKSRESYLKKVNIPAPLNYDSRHNFMNELTLYLWSRYIGSNKAAEQVKQRVENNLYFKYKISSEQFIKEQEQISELPKFDIKTRILLIDDEAEKGWERFYEHLFSRSKERVEFKSSNFTIKNSAEDVLKIAETSIREFKPDVVLLDLRLTEHDILERNPKKLAGYSILSKIKAINRGIQVVITSASNKSVIFRELLQAGADNYVLKNTDAKIGASSIIDAVDLAIKEAKILKPIHTSLTISIDAIRSDQLKKLDLGEDSDYFYKELKSELLSYLSLIQELLTNRNNTDRFSITLLQMHKCLEVIADYYLEQIYDRDAKSHHYEFYTGETVRFFNLGDGTNVKSYTWRQHGRMSVLQKFFNTYHYFTKRSKSSLFTELESLNNYRDSYSHPNLDRDFTSLETLYEKDFKTFRKSFIRITYAFFEFLNAIK